MVNETKILKHYNLFKKYAHRYFEQRDIERSVKCINLAALIGYNYNFQYSDDDLEQLISEIILITKPNSVSFQPHKNKICFYDSFGNNRVLAQQYLRAIFAMDLELLYIYSSKNLNKGVEEEILNYSKSTIIKLDKKSFKENLTYGLDEIFKFGPSTIIEQFEPNDILGFCICGSFDNVKRYFINLTDHAYWLGKNAADYFLEFRCYGAFLSHFQRNIPFEKLLFQPYYPIEAKSNFLGFPAEVVKDKIILFSGSDFYKIYGRNGHFFKMVERILHENEDVIFLLAGNGNVKPIQTFIKKNNFQKRFILLGYRPDINEVIKRIDIFINTYPVIGGLMSQYAAVNHKPIIGFTDSDFYSFNDTEDLLQTKKKKGVLVKTTLDDFHNELNLLIKNENLRLNNISVTENCVITPDDFTILLSRNLSDPQHIRPSFTENIQINLKSIFNLYIDMEVNFLKQHYIYIWKVLKSQIFRDNIFIGFTSFLLKVKLYIKLRI
jgi:hypothetical protein